MRILGLFAVFFGLPLVGLEGQTVSGTVTENASGGAVRGAAVILADLNNRVRAAVITDSAGKYRVIAPSPGSYRLSIQRIGLTALQTPTLMLEAGRDTVINSEMELAVVPLPGVSVVAKQLIDRPPGNPHKYDEFLRRRKIGLGHFITREDIEAQPRERMQEVFNGIPGIKVRQDGTRWFIQSQRCSGRGIPGLDAGALGGSSSSGRARDPKLDAMLFIDGFRVRDIAALADISPHQVEAIEVYQGAAQLPAEARGDSCFAIFVWLRSG